ncbi:MAG: DUF4159 domain-containing protein [Isosphaeraceae bacterium]|nr:DUF4159 domain-containing protein [Isosphaeraceae bacterium]
MLRAAYRAVLPMALAAMVLAHAAAPVRAAVTREDVERAISEGVRYLKSQQRPDGSWPDADHRAQYGTTALVTLALLTAGERPESPAVARALNFLQRYSAAELHHTYSVALQTMVFAAANPKRYQVAIADNVAWLERAQIKANDHFANGFPGAWTYSSDKEGAGDNSNTQYALLGLNAAAEVGIPVKPEVWALARQYWEQSQRPDGSWGYMPSDHNPPSASMTCAGISSLIITGLKRYEGHELLREDGSVKNCGRGGFNPSLQRGIDWLATHFRVGENYGRGQLWKYYYLYGLERTGRLTGLRFFGDHDWYREGAEHLVSRQERLGGFWPGGESAESNYLVSTSFALLFLAKGRAPVLINKLRHGPGTDWNNDRDDVRNLVGFVSRDWGHLLTWQTVDPGSASVEDLHQAPILFFNGHEPPVFSAEAKKNLRAYIEQGGFLFAEACCGRPEFDRGFRDLVKELFPEPEYELKPLSDDHPVWRSRYLLKPDVHPLWGIEHGCRTVVIYSPGDLSCYWNQMEIQPAHVMVEMARRVGQNVIDYATGREVPDKLEVRSFATVKLEPAKRGALYIAKLKHAGDWNVAPLAVPNLANALRAEPLKFDVVINHREIYPRDPNLIHYPLIYMHGRAAFSFSEEDLAALRRHLEPGGGTLFADAACGSPAFDASFRKFVAELLPEHPLVPIPKDDEIYGHSRPLGFDLSRSQYTKAAGGGEDYPQLEGVQLNGHWAIIYSKYDIGCALERQSGHDCKGYVHESALKIAANIVLYATLP